MNSGDVARQSPRKVLILDGDLRPVAQDIFGMLDSPIRDAPAITIEIGHYDIDRSLDDIPLLVRNRKERRALASSRLHPAGWKHDGRKQHRAREKNAAAKNDHA